MNIEGFREYCLSKPDVEECFPFDKDTLVFKVHHKMFALTDLSEDFSINLKCDPEKALSLREHYPCVHAGYHMNKSHWNTVIIDGTVSDKILRDWIDHSYDLVANGLKTNARKKINSY